MLNQPQMAARLGIEPSSQRLTGAPRTLRVSGKISGADGEDRTRPASLEGCYSPRRRPLK